MSSLVSGCTGRLDHIDHFPIFYHYAALLHNPSGRPPANTDVSGLVDCLDESEQGPLPHDQLVRVQP